MRLTLFPLRKNGKEDTIFLKVFFYYKTPLVVGR